MKKLVSVLSATVLLLTTVLTPLPAAAAEKVPQGFEKSAYEFVQGIGAGWNLGNSLDSHIQGPWYSDGLGVDFMEKCYNNPITTPDMMAAVKVAGFNAIRIPVTWFEFTGRAPEYKIRADWMARVREVVDYAIDLDMYVILNLHHDGVYQPAAGGNGAYYGWLQPTRQAKASALNQLEKMWTQIAVEFQNYPANLIFEGMNEVGLQYGWEGTPESRAIVNEYNAKFVETVRTTGGNNKLRYLICPTHGTCPSTTAFADFNLPDDERLIVSVHIYINQAAGDFTGLQAKVDELQTNCLDKGIPVIVGEWGIEDNVSDSTRAQYAQTFLETVNRPGIRCFYWDDGAAISDGGHVLLDRNNQMQPLNALFLEKIISITGN